MHYAYLQLLPSNESIEVHQTRHVRASDKFGTVFNVISKSGETAETAAQFMLVRRMLEDALGYLHAYRDHPSAIPHFADRLQDFLDSAA